MDLILIRHGQSHANKDGLLISNDQDTLTEKGIVQSNMTKQTLSMLNFIPQFVYTSHWRRATMTTKIVFDQNNYLINEDSRLGETQPGVFGSMLETEFNRKYPEFRKNIMNKYQGGESHYEMSTRVIEWLKECIVPTMDTHGLIAVVSHGGPISIILQYFLNIPIETHYPTFCVPNGSISLLEWQPHLTRYTAKYIGLSTEAS